MQVTTFEGVIENGKIRLNTNINLPEKTKVYVVVPGLDSPQVAHIYSPRLAHPVQAVDFKKEVIEGSPDDSI